MNSDDEPFEATGANCQPSELFIGSIPIRALIWPASANQKGRTSVQSSTLVLLHGIGDWAEIWCPVIESWPRIGDVRPAAIVAFDLPGHGKSGGLASGAYSLYELGRELGRAIAEMQLHRPVLVGHSLGAALALQLAVDWPEAFLGAVLIDMSIDPPPSAAAAIIDRIALLKGPSRTLEDLIGTIVKSLPFGNFSAVRSSVSRLIGLGVQAPHIRVDSGVELLLRSPWHARVIRGLLATCSVPVALVRGEYSSMFTLKEVDEVSRRLSSLISIDSIASAGHAIPLEQPTALAATLAKRLTEIENVERVCKPMRRPSRG